MAAASATAGFGTDASHCRWEMGRGPVPEAREGAPEAGEGKSAIAHRGAAAQGWRGWPPCATLSRRVA